MSVPQVTEKEFYCGDLFRHTGCGPVSVACDFLGASWSVKKKSKLASLRQKYYLHLGISQPQGSGRPFGGYISTIKCLKTFSKPTLNVLSQNEEVESPSLKAGRSVRMQLGPSHSNHQKAKG